MENGLVDAADMPSFKEDVVAFRGVGVGESTLANFVRKFGDMDHFRPTTAGYGLKLNW